MVFQRPVIKLARKFYTVGVLFRKMPVCQSEIFLNKDSLFDKMFWKNALTFKSPRPQISIFSVVFFHFKTIFFFTTILGHIERKHKLIILQGNSKEQ